MVATGKLQPHRTARPGWTYWGNQANDGYAPTWETYSNHSQAGRVAAE